MLEVKASAGGNVLDTGLTYNMDSIRMICMKRKSIYPIRYVAQQTGLTQHVIRAWEKRYESVRPYRTDTNRRLYSEEDVCRLKLLKQAVAAGHSISRVSGLPEKELSQLIGNLEMPSGAVRMGDPPAIPSQAGELYPLCLNSVLNLDHRSLENALSRAAVELSRPNLIETLIFPLLREIGDLWLDGKLKIIHEHMATSVIRSLIWDMLRSTIPPAGAPGIFVATPAGQWHELGALMIAVAAADIGWRACYFGPNLPAEEIAAAAGSLKVQMVGLSILYCAEEHCLLSELQKLRRFLPDDITILVGGSCISTLEKMTDGIGVRPIKDIMQFKQTLNSAGVGD